MEDSEVKQKEEIAAESETEKEEEKENESKDIKFELESTKDKLLRIAAEYENYRRRTEKEKSLIYADATNFAVLSILPIIDSLEFAFKSMDMLTGEHKKGIDMVKKQLSVGLEKLDVTPFGEKGEEFDPNLHSAVSQINSEGKKDDEKQIISEVFQKGYKMNGKVVRHASVQVTS
ncbi:MAG: nucleotide exchange factor GrpE [Oscillospiraceae bacterium]|jgi:molecular chaperone GrpE|nr:nucleotide exchange factor GrpE [Oscillospiraceae bacterium]